jgi:hypothetical protein
MSRNTFRSLRLAALGNELAHAFDKLVNVLLMSCEIGREVTALGQAQTGAAREEIDDFRATSGGANNPVDLIARVVRSLDRGNDDFGVNGGSCQSHGDSHALILAEMAGDFGHQQLAKQVKILPLLFGRGEAPEAAKTGGAI